jgi:hypothetical protein
VSNEEKNEIKANESPSVTAGVGEKEMDDTMRNLRKTFAGIFGEM